MRHKKEEYSSPMEKNRTEPATSSASACPMIGIFTWAPLLLSFSICAAGILPAISSDLYECVPVVLNAVNFFCCLIGGSFPYFLLLAYFRRTGQGRKSFAVRSFLLGWSHRVHLRMYQMCACFQLLYVASAMSYLVHLLRLCSFTLAYLEAALLLMTLVLIIPFVVWKWVTFSRHGWSTVEIYAAMSNKFGVDTDLRARVEPTGE
jgi:hypothetical protein